eukprot:scaffold59485_cov26-Phaeocystis_antarctica.AAC.1
MAEERGGGMGEVGVSPQPAVLDAGRGLGLVWGRVGFRVGFRVGVRVRARVGVGVRVAASACSCRHRGDN